MDPLATGQFSWRSQPSDDYRAPNSLGRRRSEPVGGLARTDRGRLQAGVVEKILVAGDDRLGFRGSHEREQVVVAAVAQHRLGIDRIVEHHCYAPDRAHGLLGLVLVEQRTEVRLRELSRTSAINVGQATISTA